MWNRNEVGCIVCTFSAFGTRKSEKESLTVTEAENGDNLISEKNI